MHVIQHHIEAALLRGIAGAARLDSVDRQKPMLIVEEIETVDWASATFIGARITLHLRLEGPALRVSAAFAALEERLADWEFRVAGQIVADIELDARHEDVAEPSTGSAETASVASIGPSTVSRPFKVNVLTIID
jgi:hypothetical protein